MTDVPLLLFVALPLLLFLDRLSRHQQGSLWPHRHLRLPVLLAGAQVQGGRLVVDLLHYPLLLRWADWYRGSHPAKYLPSVKQHDGSDSNGVLRCTVAGLQGVSELVGPLLQQRLTDPWRANNLSSNGSSGSGSVATWPQALHLRAFALTALQPRPAVVAAAVSAVGLASTPTAAIGENSVASQPADGSTAAPSSADRFSPSHSASSVSSNNNRAGLGRQKFVSCNSSKPDQTGNNQQQQHQMEGSEQDELVQEVWGELWLKGLMAPALLAAAKQVASQPNTQSIATRQSDGTPAAAHGTAVPLQQQAGARMQSSWLPQPRKDAAELLLRHGLAYLAEPEDCEWLGIRQSRWKAYQRAQDRARRQKIGVHAAAAVRQGVGVLAAVWARIKSVVGKQ